MRKHSELKPFLKWTGGKRWFVKEYSDLFPNEFNRYFEPFLGSGVVFFYLEPKKAYLSDINKKLIDTYKAIQENPQKVKNRLKYHSSKHNKDYYYKIRKRKSGNIYSSAGDFIYLNRTCWNGLYRVNFKGEFNVPIGDRDNVLRKEDDFDLISNVLSNTKLKSCSYFESLKNVKDNDFCFIDPPYTVKHDNNGFIRYNEKLFSWENQERLRDCLVGVKKRGGKALVLNANHKSIQDLYKGVGKIIPLSRNSLLAAKSSFRGKTNELAILIGYDS